MAFLFFGLWVVFNGQWTTEIALLGVVISALLYLFVWKFMGYDPKKEWRAFKKIPLGLAYCWYLVVEIVKANWAVLHLIYSPKVEVEPVLTTFKTKVKTDTGKVVLANSITLTPGTITVHMKDDTFMVHCLDSSMSDGLADSEFERKILRLEEE